MTKHSARSGYIIVVTMMMMAMGISIITYVLVRGTSYVPFIDAVRKQEKARSLAFGGLQAAMAQLAMPVKDDNNKKTVDASKAVLAKPHDDSKHLATLLLPKLNRWQQFKLQEHIEGVDATISFAISAEDGKINLNQIYDFENKEFRDEKKAGGGWKKLLQNLFARIEKQVGGKELFKNFEKELKKRQYKFNDVTELLTVPGFIVFNNTIFYEPPLIATRKGSKTAGRPLYLTDIFTIHTQKYTIDPWVFADSLAGLLELKRAESGDHEQRVKMVEQVIKQFKKESSLIFLSKSISEALLKAFKASGFLSNLR